MATFKFLTGVLNHVLSGGKEFVTYDYGVREQEDYPEHHGIDLQCGVGGLSYIIAIADGVVYDVNTSCPHNYGKTSSCCNECGNYVSIKHNGGYKTRYMHMKPGSVTHKVGDKIKRGDVLGYMGTTGYSTGNHLHFDVRYNNLFVDPVPFLLGTSIIDGMTSVAKDSLSSFISKTKKVSKSVNRESKLKRGDNVVVLPGTLLIKGVLLDKNLCHAPMTISSVKGDIAYIAVAGHTIGAVKKDRLLPRFDFTLMKATDALNVRDFPSTKTGNKIGVLNIGEYVITSTEAGDIDNDGRTWRYCYLNGNWGFVCSDYLTHE